MNEPKKAAEAPQREETPDDRLGRREVLIVAGASLAPAVWSGTLTVRYCAAIDSDTAPAQTANARFPRILGSGRSSCGRSCSRAIRRSR